MNYSKLQTYLKEKILKLAINTQNDPQTEEITGLKAEWLTANNLTASKELTEVLTRFYESVVAMITPANVNNVHLLPDYELLIADYLVTNKPGLGKNEDNISDEHYQLLDKVIVEFKESLAEEEEKEEDTPANVKLLQDQTLAVNQQVTELIKSKASDTNLATEMVKLFGQDITSTEPDLVKMLVTKEVVQCQPLFKLLLSYPESKPIITSVKQWLIAYQQLTQSEQALLTNEWTIISRVNQIIISCQSKDQDEDKKEDEQETTEKPAKEPIKNKEELMYFGGFILLLAVVAMLFKQK